MDRRAFISGITLGLLVRAALQGAETTALGFSEALPHRLTRSLHPRGPHTAGVENPTWDTVEGGARSHLGGGRA